VFIEVDKDDASMEVVDMNCVDSITKIERIKFWIFIIKQSDWFKHVKSRKMTCLLRSDCFNFDSTFRGRKEVQKNKPTPYCLTKFHGESEKKYLENIHFRPKRFLK
jgi:hypothetical protein